MRFLQRLAVFAGLLAGLFVDTAWAEEPTTPLTQELAGTVVTYRFPIGRLYRASYSAASVRFELVEPQLTEQPAATLPYVARRIRENVYLVAWHGDPRFHSTQLIDLEKRELHASALLEGERGFFESARIEEIVRAP